MNDTTRQLDRLLFTQAAIKHPEFRQKIVDMGANVNAIYGGRTPIIFSTYNSDEIDNYTEFLVSNGANVNAKDSYGETALFHAVWAGNLPVVQYLLAHGADIHVIDNQGRNLLHKVNNPELAKFLIKQGVDINAKDKYGYSPLFTTELGNTIEMLKFLIDIGADIHCYSDIGGSLLNRYYDKLDVIDFLLDQGVDPNIKTENDELPIFGAALFASPDENNKDHIKTLMKLLEKTKFD